MLRAGILDYEQAGRVGGDFLQKNVSLAGVSTKTTLVENTDENVQVQVFSLILGVDTAASFEVKTGDSKILDITSIYNGFPNLVSDHPEMPRFVGNLGEDISITPDKEIEAGSVYIQYKLRSIVQ